MPEAEPVEAKENDLPNVSHYVYVYDSTTYTYMTVVSDYIYVYNSRI